MYLLHVSVRHPILGDSRNQSWQFDPTALDAAKMQALRTKIIAWCTDLDAAAAANTDALPL